MINQRDINSRVERFRKAGEREKINPPAFVSMSSTKAGIQPTGEIRLAKLTQSADIGTRLKANLLDSSGKEITTGDGYDVFIYFLCYGTANLNETLPLLQSGWIIPVVNKFFDGYVDWHSGSGSGPFPLEGDQWLCLFPMQRWIICQE
ncbi:MAG: hypothetical protein A2Y12_08855 [Planctomycetes bacterium GWF2_42_9]|nr:MAG: hypothetical protein A2Y12_08855 [Planctomycetes bacterium GWF2_42_9]HAL45507.1 hypothetical protein [Phycisphaerales bacterium]